MLTVKMIGMAIIGGLLVISAMIPTKVILGEEGKLTETEKETYALVKEELIKEIEEKGALVEWLGTHGIRKIITEIMSEPHIMEEFLEALAHLTGKGELSPSITEYTEGIRSLKGSILGEMTERLPTN
jgi:hypothetical protein